MCGIRGNHLNWSVNSLAMFSKTINLRHELDRAKRQASAQDLLESVTEILAKNKAERLDILRRLESGSGTSLNNLDLEQLESGRMYHIGHIKKVCIDYRLRFLESNMFKHDFPAEAISEIRNLEKQHQTTLNGFRIIAPTKAFHLLNYNDPMLFVPIGNDYYYLIHQWGDDLKASRKWLVWPLRNIGTFTLLCLAVSIFVTLLFPVNRLGENIRMATIIVFLFAFKSIFAVFMYGFFMGGRKFSAQMWNSKFYNN